MLSVGTYSCGMDGVGFQPHMLQCTIRAKVPWRKTASVEHFDWLRSLFARGIVGESTDPLTVDTLHQSPVVQKLVQIMLL